MDDVNCQNYAHRDEFAINELFNNVPLPFLSTSSSSAAANNFPQLISSSSRHNHYNIKSNITLENLSNGCMYTYHLIGYINIVAHKQRSLGHFAACTVNIPQGTEPNSHFIFQIKMATCLVHE